MKRAGRVGTVRRRVTGEKVLNKEVLNMYESSSKQLMC